jgi:RNA polymerase sigma factor (sigma-70 family)
MVNPISDAMLLERFVTSREEAAFATLVQRHGPVVLGACRRVLRDEHEAEDAFQATFLLLARKAAEIPWRDSVGGWLCAVAHRLSLNARCGTARRCRYETPMAALARPGPGVSSDEVLEECHSQGDPLTEIARRELRRVLDDELDRLPEKYRAPVVLCYLEGMTNEEAARELGWPTGSMSRRLDRARVLLRQRLASRGLGLSLLALVGLVAGLSNVTAIHQLGQESVAPQVAMSIFQPSERGARDLGATLAGLQQASPSLPPKYDLLTLASVSSGVAEQIRGFDPGRNRVEWQSYVTEMRDSALQLAAATRENDGSAIMAAAHQLNSSCLKCHAAFRQ